MSAADELRALAERVMAFNGSDAERNVLGWQVCDAVGLTCDHNGLVLNPLISLDAAMTLAREFLLVAMSDIAADGLPGVCLCSDTSTTPPKEHWGIALGSTVGPREQVLARCYTAAALLARAEVQHERAALERIDDER